MSPSLLYQYDFPLYVPVLTYVPSYEGSEAPDAANVDPRELELELEGLPAPVEEELLELLVNPRLELLELVKPKLELLEELELVNPRLEEELVKPRLLEEELLSPRLELLELLEAVSP